MYINTVECRCKNQSYENNNISNSFNIIQNLLADVKSMRGLLLPYSYIPAGVDHRGGMPCHGTFMLHQVGHSGSGEVVMIELMCSV